MVAVTLTEQQLDDVNVSLGADDGELQRREAKKLVFEGTLLVDICALHGLCINAARFNLAEQSVEQFLVSVVGSSADHVADDGVAATTAKTHVADLRQVAAPSDEHLHRLHVTCTSGLNDERSLSVVG